MNTFTIFSPPFYLYKIVTEYRQYVRWELLNNKLHCTYVAKNTFVKQKTINIVPIQEQAIKGWMWSQLQVGNSNENKLQHAGRSLENWGYPESAEMCPSPSWESFSLMKRPSSFLYLFFSLMHTFPLFPHSSLGGNYLNGQRSKIHSLG